MILMGSSGFLPKAESVQQKIVSQSEWGEGKAKTTAENLETQRKQRKQRDFWGM